MERELITYLDFINSFENLLIKEFNIESDIWNASGKKIPKSGIIGDYKYNFHGAGCEVIKDNIICEYDIAPLHKNYVIFSPWKFFNFIKTNPYLNDSNREKFELGLLALIKEKKISKLLIDEIDTGTYMVKKKMLHQ